MHNRRGRPWKADCAVRLRTIASNRSGIQLLAELVASPSLDVGSLLLLAEPSLLRGARRRRGLAGARDHERRANQFRQPMLRGRTILALTSTRAGDHSKPAVAVEARGELPFRPRALLRVQRARRTNVPEELYARRRGVHVLAARASGSRRPKHQLRSGNRDPRRYSKYPLHGHA